MYEYLIINVSLTAGKNQDTPISRPSQASMHINTLRKEHMMKSSSVKRADVADRKLYRAQISCILGSVAKRLPDLDLICFPAAST